MNVLPRGRAVLKRMAYNERLLLWEGAVANFGLSLVTPFIAVYAIELGASDRQIGWLTSLPALVNVAFMVPMARIAQRFVSQKRLAAAGALGSRAFYLLMAFIPLLPINRSGALIACVTAMTLPSVLLNITWMNLQGRLFSPAQRAAVLGFRNGLVKLVSIGGTLVAGYALARTPFPVNYLSLFILTFICCLISFILILRIDESDAVEGIQGLERVKSQPYLSQLKAILADESYGRGFILFLISMFVFHLGLNTTAPIWPIYHVKELGLSTADIGLLNTVAGAASVVGFFYLGRFSSVKGEEAVLLASVVGNALFPFMYSLFANMLWMLVFQAFVGFWNAGWGLTIYTILLRSSKEEFRPTCTATFHTAIALTGFLGPTLGTLLVELMPVKDSLRVASAIRIIAGIVLTVGMVMLRRRGTSGGLSEQSLSVLRRISER